MNYGFAGIAYFGIFLCWFGFMYCTASIVGNSLGDTEDDGACKTLLRFVKVFATLVGLSFIVGVVQFIIETISTTK